MPFNTTKHKIKNLIKTSNETQQSISEAEYSTPPKFLENSVYSVPKLLDSIPSEITEKENEFNIPKSYEIVNVPGTFISATPGVDMLQTYSYDYQSKELEMNDFLFPFISAEATFYLPESATPGTIYQQETTRYEDENCLLTGDSLIYKGLLRPDYLFTDFGVDKIFTQEDIDNGIISDDKLKKIYYATIYFTEDGNDYKMSGYISSVKAVKYEPHTTSGDECTDKYEYTADLLDDSSLSNYGEIIDMSNTDITMIAREVYTPYIQKYYYGSPYCEEQSDEITNRVEITIPTTSNEIWRIDISVIEGTLWKKIADVWTLQAFGNFGTNNSLEGSENVEDVEFIGYWLFYSTEKTHLVYLDYVYGEFFQKQYDEFGNAIIRPTNLPEDITSYTTLTFKRNYDELVLTSEFSNVIPQSQQEMTIEKVGWNSSSKPTRKCVFRKQFNCSFFLKATEAEQLGSFSKTISIFHQDEEGEWFLGSEVATELPLIYYRMPNSQIGIQIKLIIKNPLSFHEITNYQPKS